MKGINDIIGAIDGCKINIKKSAVDGYVYCNRKSEYSTSLQGVCDYKKKFIDSFCGEAGSIHDSRLLKRLSEESMNGFIGSDFLLGDSAYLPFRDNGRLTKNQKTFNYKHSSSRVVIEDAFGLLIGRFRRLKSFENSNVLLITKYVVAPVVLHDICIHFHDFSEDLEGGARCVNDCVK
nr:unnamed protein product [Callosobruchus analis]